jgi:hypothetical protein
VVTLLFLGKNGIDQYIQLKENDGSTAWLFCDLIYLTLTHDILNLSTFDSSDAWFEAGDYVYQITVKCAKNKSIFSEWMAYIYFRNLVTPRLKIEQNRFQMIFSRETLERHLSREQIKFLYEILNGDSTELIKLDALTWQFTRALEDDHDFNHNDKIKKAGYIRKISEILNRSNYDED